MIPDLYSKAYHETKKGKIMGYVLIVLSVISFGYGIMMQPDTVQQQTIQYLVYICSSVFISAGLICLSIKEAEPQSYSDDLRQIDKKLDAVSKHFEKVEKAAEEERRRREKQLADEAEEKRKQSYASFEDLLKDPEIKEGSDMMYKMYGEDARKRYLEDKMKQYGIEKP